MSNAEIPLSIVLPVSSDKAVHERYSTAAKQFEPELCCAVQYDAKYLAVIPREIIERDYGCGDPTRFVRPGETVLDLGSGGGKVCYIAAQVVGPAGRVIGIDCNDEMLELARKYRAQVAESLGYANVEFRKGRIQDLKLDLDLLDAHLRDRPVDSSSAWLEAERQADQLRAAAPLVPADSVDVIVSNCVLNLIRRSDRRQLFAEMYRVLRCGGRVVISDIVCDDDVPTHLQQDPRLWSGCISGAFREDEFLEALEEAGFHGMQIVDRQADPWTVVDGIEFRSLTVEAFKGYVGECLDLNQAVIYQGPWKAVVDDHGQTLMRGERIAVCDRSFQNYSRAPYAEQVIRVSPLEDVPRESAPLRNCNATEVRSAAETKIGVVERPHAAGGCCEPGTCC